MSDLTQALLSEEILTLNRDGASGVLAAALSEGTQKSLFFRSGRIVFACSSLEKDKLGEHLIKLGRISRADFANAYKESLSRKQRLGQTLVNAGLVGADDLGRLVALQVQKIVLSMFTWTMGETRFSAMVDPIHDDLCVDLSTRRLLFEGSRVFPDVVRLEAALGNPERRVRVAARPPFDVGRIALSPAEKSVIRDATNEPRISDVLAGSFPRPLLVRGIYSLFVGGIIEPIESQEIIVSSIEEDTVGFRLALTPVPVAAAATPVDTSQADLKQRVLQMYEA
ncbi:MAG: DUF4388 domain-containing protein, partial [Vicinamibacteria bacterium]|nr:DUF4388 domain-containing protein [Vicinamibacteria bacterium]